MYRNSLGIEWEENMLLDYSDELEKKVVWELMYYRQTKWAWEDEVAAYCVLSKTTLAGVGVPLFYGAGELVLEEARAIVPRILVISVAAGPARGRGPSGRATILGELSH